MNEMQMPDPQGSREYFENKIRYSTGPVEVNQMLESGEDIVVVDVRDEEDYRKAHIPGSVNLPRNKWQSFDGLRKDRTNILVCYTETCHLAAKAGYQFASAGYPVMEMDGGFAAWTDNDLDTESGNAWETNKKREALAV